ncbi:hypothetical protein CBR_g40825 [Chara braunii]|uniref:Reverse transcriptase/retrotransposon-derived protein RNase H-like domain-containing protein n=1 Tax=Chara braunii TaxID=69332 RepID=A0A388LUX3_CHABU|nr:hypothetical protein CBR_g40825 [Chara braunii]|eukprot:GBG86012.1 hypothetical protein CBR_g40825 [Chara braunii]
MVDTRTGKSTTPYTQAQEEKMAAILKERKEKKELLRQAKMKAIEEEQATKEKKLEEELRRLQQEEEEKKEVAEEEVAAEEEEGEKAEPLERRRTRERGESSGTKEEDSGIEKNISEWVPNLSLGEEEEAMLYVPQEEKDVVVREFEAMDNPLDRQALENENKLEWKLHLAREKKRRREEASRMAKEMEKVHSCRKEVEAHQDIQAKLDKILTSIEILGQAWTEQQLTSQGQDMALHSVRLGFRDFAHNIVTLLGSQVQRLKEGAEKFSTGALEGAKAIATAETEARPRKEPVKLEFPDAYGGKPKKNFDNWEASVNSYVYLQHIVQDEQVLVAFHALKDEAASLANYYRKFVRNFSTITAPLRRLLKKETIWQWDRDCTSALKKLKRTLIEYPVLKVADPSLPFVVTTDASQYGIGAVLQQDDDNGYRPVDFMSARIPSEKVATSTYERELYALRKALEHWKHYLLGRHFKVYLNHETLRWLKTQAKMTPKLTRWADFELKPVKDTYNVVADALSRRSDYFGAIAHYLDIGSDLQEKVRQAYAQDPIYSDLLKRVKEAPETEPDYRTTKGLLFERTNVVDRLCVPNREEIRSLILGEYHDTEGHFGWQKTLANLMHAYTWPGMKNDCIELRGGCRDGRRKDGGRVRGIGLQRDELNLWTKGP